MTPASVRARDASFGPNGQIASSHVQPFGVHFMDPFRYWPHRPLESFRASSSGVRFLAGQNWMKNEECEDSH